MPANPGFALGQFLKSGKTAWLNVLRGMLDGFLNVGSRKPVSDVPVWATLEVLYGGFASGRLAAEGPEDCLKRNSAFLEEAGELLGSGKYRVNVPEEGALLAVAWLRRAGRMKEADDILAELGPWFERLRFYPAPAAAPLPDGDSVWLQDLGETVAQLRAQRVGVEYERQRETLEVWIPLLDRAVSLYAETMEDGWPLRRLPGDWNERARALVVDFDAALMKRVLCRRPRRKRENLPRLIGYLRREPRSLSGRDVGMIRRILRDIVLKRGLPGSELCRAARKLQKDQLRNPRPWELAKSLADRLAALPQDRGLPKLEEIPPVLERVASRSLEAPVKVLIERGVIRSSEMLARVAPAMAARAQGRRVEDPALRKLYESLYRAFRRRRSLLLLDYEKQVKLHELPWVSPLLPAAEREDARAALEELVVLALGSWPERILPNKLLQDLVPLAKAAGIETPLVDEVAADIFMGGFTEKYLLAAKAAGRLLKGTFYERYYGISYDSIAVIDDVKEESVRRSEMFDDLCRKRAGEPKGWGGPARNGKIIEQEQILTTHNLATFFVELGLKDKLDPLPLARRAFEAADAMLRPPKVKLRVIKNAAYAWRQMIFYASLLPDPEPFIVWAESRAVSDRTPVASLRFKAPAFTGWTSSPKTGANPAP